MIGISGSGTGTGSGTGSGGGGEESGGRLDGFFCSCQ